VRERERARVCTRDCACLLMPVPVVRRHVSCSFSLTHKHINTPIRGSTHTISLTIQNPIRVAGSAHAWPPSVFNLGKTVCTAAAHW